jgi:hypothetical protein
MEKLRSLEQENKHSYKDFVTKATATTYMR